MELLNCQDLAVPMDVMQHVVRVESSFNPYAIGVVGGRLVRQPKSLGEAVSTARMLETKGYNFSLGLAQVNRYNLAKYGLASYREAFQACPNLRAGTRILAECHRRTGGDLGKSLSCYYSGNTVTGFRHGYVQKVFASMRASGSLASGIAPIPVVDRTSQQSGDESRHPVQAASRRSAVEKRLAVAVPTASPRDGNPPTVAPPSTTSFHPPGIPDGAEVQDEAFVF